MGDEERPHGRVGTDRPTLGSAEPGERAREMRASGPLVAFARDDVEVDRRAALALAVGGPRHTIQSDANKDSATFPAVPDIYVQVMH